MKAAAPPTHASSRPSASPSGSASSSGIARFVKIAALFTASISAATLAAQTPAPAPDSPATSASYPADQTPAQTPPAASIGSVSTADADVTNGPGGLLQVAGGRATLAGSSSLTARDRTAAITLTRGGDLRLCQTSTVHLTEAGESALLIALDRGAMEIRTPRGAGMVIVTPDLRLTPADAGALDLQMRVTRNGDTCVENRGRKAPVLSIVDTFGQATYQLAAGQHVLFEHGSLREVVDRETTPCGCPPELHPVPLAEALVRGGRSGKVTPQQAQAANPFPTAVSEGLAQPTPPAPETPGVTHVQVASTLTFDPTAARTPAQPAQPAQPAPAPQSPSAADPTPPAKPPSTGGPLGAIGRFFKHIFVR